MLTRPITRQDGEELAQHIAPPHRRRGLVPFDPEGREWCSIRCLACWPACLRLSGKTNPLMTFTPTLSEYLPTRREFISNPVEFGSFSGAVELGAPAGAWTQGASRPTGGRGGQGAAVRATLSDGMKTVQFQLRKREPIG